MAPTFAPGGRRVLLHELRSGCCLHPKLMAPEPSSCKEVHRAAYTARAPFPFGKGLKNKKTQPNQNALPAGPQNSDAALEERSWKRTTPFPCKTGGEEKANGSARSPRAVSAAGRLTVRLLLARLPERKDLPPPLSLCRSWTNFRSPSYCLHPLNAPYRSPASLTLSTPKPMFETLGG